MKTFKLLVPAVALTLAGFASAGTRAVDGPSVVVPYGDLNLNSKAGVKTLHSRIRTAAATVCASLDSRVLGMHEDYERCVSAAVTDGVKQVANVNLTNLHRFGRHSAVS